MTTPALELKQTTKRFADFAAVVSLRRVTCDSHRQPGRYSCHELRSVSVWPRPQHTELSSTSRVASSDFARR